MMQYWLCITTRENWEVIRKEKVWGVPDRHRKVIEQVEPGDKLLIYVKQEIQKGKKVEPKIVAVYEAVGKAFRDEKKIFVTPKGMGDEVFPWRVKLKELKVFKKPVEFKPLIPKLEFIRNKKMWAGHLMGKAMRKISERDYKTILESA